MGTYLVVEPDQELGFSPPDYAEQDMSPPFQAQRLPDGRIQAPMRAEADDGTVGDGVAILAPGDSGGKVPKRPST